jgi:hypothetical protein
MATLNKRYLCAPVPGSPNILEYLDKFSMYIIYNTILHKDNNVYISDNIYIVHVSRFYILYKSQGTPTCKNANREHDSDL